MHPAGKFRGQGGVYHPVAVDPALPSEGLRHNINAVMRLSFRTMARVTAVLVRFIDHVQVLGCEGFCQLSRD